MVTGTKLAPVPRLMWEMVSTACKLCFSCFPHIKVFVSTPFLLFRTLSVCQYTISCVDLALCIKVRITAKYFELYIRKRALNSGPSVIAFGGEEVKFPSSCPLSVTYTRQGNDARVRLWMRCGA